MRYDIADELPEYARRAAAAESYRFRFRDWRDIPDGTPGTVGGDCPLGVALRALGHDVFRRPGPGAVARVLEPPGRVGFDTRRFERIQLAAHRFAADFDADRIADVGEAMGVSDG